MDGDSLHVNSKTGLPDFLLADTDLQSCDDVADDLQMTPLEPAVSDASCDAAGALTLPEVRRGVNYTIDPAYTDGASGDFTVTAAPEGVTGPHELHRQCSGNDGVHGGNPPVRSGTLAGSPNTAMDSPTNRLP